MLPYAQAVCNPPSHRKSSYPPGLSDHNPSPCKYETQEKSFRPLRLLGSFDTCFSQLVILQNEERYHGSFTAPRWAGYDGHSVPFNLTDTIMGHKLSWEKTTPHNLVNDVFFLS
jgi:hypothetical protein